MITYAQNIPLWYDPLSPSCLMQVSQLQWQSSSVKHGEVLVQMKYLDMCGWSLILYNLQYAELLLSGLTIYSFYCPFPDQPFCEIRIPEDEKKPQ